MYVTTEEYLANRQTVPSDKLAQALETASRHIDTLTFNRIRKIGFENLTAFQQEIIKEVVIAQADFEYENADILASPLSSYSINGVSMTFGNSWNVMTENGVAVSRENYSILQQTGLCCRMAR